jgi:small-conductance mechanosensitive channel
MPLIRHRLQVAALVCASLLVFMLLPASPSPAADANISLQDARQQLTAIQQTIAAANERRLREVREKVLTLQTQLHQASSELEPELAQVKARVAELGATPEETKEPTEVARQRQDLEKQEGELEGELRLAKVLALEADQTLSRITSRSREQFRERLGDRSPSPFEGSFWAELRADAPKDFQRASAFMRLTYATLRRSSAIAWLAALVATTLVLLARSLISRRLRTVAAVGPWRALGAFISVLLNSLAAATIAVTIVLAINSNGGEETRISVLLSGMVITIAFGTYVYALGSALLYRDGHPDRHAPLLPNALSARLEGFSLWFALTITLVALVEQLAVAIDMSPSLSVALDGLMTLILAATLTRGLRRAIYPRGSLPTWLTICLGIGWVAVASGALSVLVGYVALGSFIVGQFAWALIVIGSAYLLDRLVGDTLSALSSKPHEAATPHSAAGPRRRTAVLAAALARCAIVVIALLLLLAPFGAGAVDLVQQFHRIRQGISIGAVQLRPAAVARALIILALGLSAVRLIRNWFQRRYLPLTQLDVGMRHSVTSLISYAGYTVVVALTLSAMGVGMQQIAWIVSALALGVGFGLQAIVQNFVCGLILLTERPVRVGDWVALGEFEGDVRRISARATQIQRLDRSTVIVPNSEFITKVVRNITYDDPLGRVQVKLPMPIDTDVERVRTELLRAFRAHPEILDEPAPIVLLDTVEGNSILFNAIGFVSSPRAAVRVRSAVLFDVLISLKKAGVTVTPVQVVVAPLPAASVRRAQ